MMTKLILPGSNPGEVFEIKPVAQEDVEAQTEIGRAHV